MGSERKFGIACDGLRMAGQDCLQILAVVTWHGEVDSGFGEGDVARGGVYCVFESPQLRLHAKPFHVSGEVDAFICMAGERPVGDDKRIPRSQQQRRQ